MTTPNQPFWLTQKFLGVWLILLLTACTTPPPPSPTPTATPLPSTSTPPPTLTPTPLPPVLFPEYEPITSENFQQLREVAHIQSYGQINDVALAPDGQTVAIATTSGLYFYDTQTGEVTLKAESEHNKTAFSADGSLLATVSLGNLVRVNRLDNGQLTLLHDLYEIDTRVFEIKFSLDGQQLFVQSNYPLASRKCGSPEFHYGVYDLSSSDTKILVNNILFEVHRCHFQEHTSRFTTDGKFFLFILNGGFPESFIVEAATGKIIREKPGSKYGDDEHILDISPDGSQLAIESENNPESNPITIVDFESNEVISSSGWPIAFFMDSTRQVRRLIPLGGESHLSLWENNQLICQIEPIKYGAVDPTHRYVIAGEYRIWDMSNCQEVGKIPDYFNQSYTPEPPQARAMPISSDGRYIALLAGKKLHLWQFAVRDSFPIHTPLPPQLQDVSHISSIAFVPHSPILALQTETEPLFFDVEQWEMVEADIDPLLFDYPEDIISADKNLTVVLPKSRPGYREVPVFVQTEGYRYLGLWSDNPFIYGTFTPDNRLFITINGLGDLVVYGVRKQE